MDEGYNKKKLYPSLNHKTSEFKINKIFTPFSENYY